MTKWEYKWIKGGDLYPSLLDELGRHGWEWAGMLARDYVILKRPAKPEPPAFLVVNNVTGADFQQLADSLKAELDRYWEEKEVRRD